MVENRFEDDLELTFQSLRQALIDLFGSIGVDDVRPYVVAQRLGINKNLTWKASRIIQATDPWAAIRYLPGPSGIKTLLTAFGKHGASEAVLQGVRDAQTRFDDLVAHHSGDRATFDLIRDGHDTEGALDESRKLAFRGNSGIFGIQVKTRLCLYALSPMPDGSKDKTHVTVINGFQRGRRLRSDISAPLLMRRAQIEEADGEKLKGGPRPGQTRLLDEFSTDPLPAIDEVIEQGSHIHLLAPGPIGNTAAFDLVFVTEQFFPPHVSPEPGSFAQLQLNLSLPMECLIFDFLVHRDLLQPKETPKFSVVSRYESFIPTEPVRREKLQLPTSEVVQDYGFTSPVGSPQLPEYPRILEAALEPNGFEASDYHTYRAMLQFPPMSTTAVVRYPLPEPGDASS